MNSFLRGDLNRAEFSLLSVQLSSLIRLGTVRYLMPGLALYPHSNSITYLRSLIAYIKILHIFFASTKV